jgi:hypothetical protein
MFAQLTHVSTLFQMSSFFEAVYLYILKHICPLIIDRMPPVNNILYYRVHAEKAVDGRRQCSLKVSHPVPFCFKNCYCTVLKKDKIYCKIIKTNRLKCKTRF